MRENSDNRLAILQVWRFIAASAVVLIHAHQRAVRVVPDQTSTLFGIGDLASFGNAGVDLFFVISGFIMTWTSWDRFGASPVEFWKRRVARIVPVYWLASSMIVALLILRPQLFEFGQTLDIVWIVASFGFVPWPAPGSGSLAPVLGLGWTLNYEMYFYLVFGLALLLPRSTALKALAAFFVTSVAIGTLVEFRAPLLVHNSSWLLLEFCLGILVAVLVKRQVRPSRGMFLALIGIAIAGLLQSALVWPDPVVGLHFTRFGLWGLPSAILIYCSLLRANRWTASPAGRAVVRLGDASYSVYLFQVFAVPAVAIPLTVIGLGRVLHIDVLILVIAVGSILAGVATYYLLERPLTNLAQAAVRTRKASPVLGLPEVKVPRGGFLRGLRSRSTWRVRRDGVFKPE